VEFLFEILGIVAEGGSSKEPTKIRWKKKDKRSVMPLTNIVDLPDDARAWVFGSDRTLDASTSGALLNEVDIFLSQWKAHGAPLTVGRDWRFGRFLMVAVDQSTAGASGCSIDGLFRTLNGLKARLDASLVTSGLIFFRDENGAIQSVDREEFTSLGAEGRISPETQVFDPTVTTLGEWRARFELTVADSWHAKLLEKSQPA
jgi:hypothetical protein